MGRKDVSSLFDGPVLVVMAHMDDEVLGCGGLLYTLRKSGVRVVVNWLGFGISPSLDDNSQNDHIRVVEWQQRELAAPKAMRALGVKEFTHIGQFDTGKLDQATTSTMARMISASIEAVEPVTVITHWKNDVHQDHRKVYEAVQVATRPWPGEDAISVKTVLCAEILSSTNYALSDSFHPTVFFPLSQSAMRAKYAAMQKYDTECHPAPHPRSTHGIKALAQYRGLQAGLDAAEGFIVARTVADL